MNGKRSGSLLLRRAGGRAGVAGWLPAAVFATPEIKAQSHPPPSRYLRP